MRRKLLLADDSVTIQRVIELTFADEDVQVVAVGDGKQAIAIIEQDRPDIVLADVGMPERDGYEVAAFIKGRPELSGIPVLLLTGAFEPIDETRARAVGCDGVLVKPFEPQMVINRVKDLLAGRRPAGLWGASPMAQGPMRHSPPPEAPVRAPAPPPAGTGGSLEDYFDRLDAAFANLEAAPETASAWSAPVERAPAAAPESARPPDAEPEPWRNAPAAGSPTPASVSTSLPADVLDGWDPDLTGDPRRVEPGRGSGPMLEERPDAVVEEPPAPAPISLAPPASAPAPFPVAVAIPSPPPAAPPTAVAPVPFEQPADAAAAFVPAPVAFPPASAGTEVAPPASASTAAAPAPPMPSLAEAFAALLSAEQSRVISPSVFGAPALSTEAIEDIVRRVVVRMGEQAVRDTVLDVAERLVRDEIDRIKHAAEKA